MRSLLLRFTVTACLAVGSQQLLGQELPITYFSDRDPGAKPVMKPGGGYWELKQSMDSGSVRSIDSRRVQRYYRPKTETYNGLAYWTVEIVYGEKIFAGDIYHSPLIERRAKAYVRGGEVQFWIYSDSGNYVP